MVKIIRSMNNKRGWIRLVEAFVAIVLLTSVLVVITNSNSTHKNTLQNEIAKREIAVLRDIELNDTLRGDILSVDIVNLPVEWENFDSYGLSRIKSRIDSLSPKELNCTTKLCLINEQCTIKADSGLEVYAQSIVISANLTRYSPRQLKMFCTKE